MRLHSRIAVFSFCVILNLQSFTKMLERASVVMKGSLHSSHPSFQQILSMIVCYDPQSWRKLFETQHTLLSHYSS